MITASGLSHGLWDCSSPPGPETAALTGDVAADVAIVGAGFTGLSAALRLAEQGARVVVVEGTRIGHGGSGRNVGLVNAGLWLMPEDVIAALGAEHGERLVDLLGQAPALVYELIARHAIACEPEQAGTLHCAVGKAGLRELERRTAQWSARGAPVRLLDRAETTAMTGTAVYAGALLDGRAGTIQPLAYARGLARAAIEAGVVIHEASPVLRCLPSPAGTWRIETPRGAVTAAQVIVATNAYTQGPWPSLRRELALLPYFNFATGPLSEAQRALVLPGRQGAWDTKQVLSSFRLDRAGRLIFGSVGALRGTGRGIHRAWATRAIARLFPDLGSVGFEHGWYGMIGMTADSVPRLHRLAPGVVSLSGFNGRGIAPGTMLGRVLADYVAGNVTGADLPLPFTDPMALPLRALKERGYEVGAQLLHAIEGRLPR